MSEKYEDVPSEDLLAQLARAAIAKVEEDVDVYLFEISRSEAENMYGDAMYDKANVPSSVSSLKIAHIEGWAFNCAPSDHVASTGMCGQLTMTKSKWRKSKKELEIQFEIAPAENVVEGQNKSCAAPEKAAIALLGNQPYEEAAAANAEGGDGSGSKQLITPWTVQGDDGSKLRQSRQRFWLFLSTMCSLSALSA